MACTTLIVGSLEALRAVLTDDWLVGLASPLDVVVVPTASAFTGMERVSLELAELFEQVDARVESLMVGDRASASESHFANRIAHADLVVLADGSPLHARAVWRGTAVGEAIAAASTLVAIGLVATVLGDVMIDPRGGAPMIGLGYRPGIAVCAPTSDEQTARTRSLMDDGVPLVVLGARGILAHDGVEWRVVNDDVVVSRGNVVAGLDLGHRH